MVQRKTLVIDDDPVTVAYCKKILENEGYLVDVAADGQQAISKIKSVEYKYIIVDLVLPGFMNGMDIIKKARHISPYVSIIAYSGFSDLDITDKVLRAGANKFLTKPFKPEELIDNMYS